LVAWLCYRDIRKKYKYVDNGKWYDISKLTYNLSLIQILFLPLFWANIEFYRFPRGVLPIIYFSVVNELALISNKINLKKFLVVAIGILALVWWTHVAYFKISDFKNIYLPFFENNEVLKIF
jgi:hypothetical protein